MPASANPGRRPAGLLKYVRRRNWKGLACIRTLVEIHDNRRASDCARNEAAIVLLDRGYGRPDASHRTRGRATAGNTNCDYRANLTGASGRYRDEAETYRQSNSPSPIVGEFLSTKNAICSSRFNLFSVEDVPGTTHRDPRSRTSRSQRGHVLFDCQSHLPGTESIAQRLGLYWSPWEGDPSR